MDSRNHNYLSYSNIELSVKLNTLTFMGYKYDKKIRYLGLLVLLFFICTTVNAQKFKDNFVDSTDNALYFRYGVKGGAYLRLEGSAELGLEVGYSGFYSDGSDEVVSGHGAYAAVAFSVEFF